MSKIDKYIELAKRSPQSLRFSELVKICDNFFGEPRHQGTSHRVYKLPWRGDPRVNIQKGDSGKSKPYQVKQVLAAIKKLEDHKND